MKSSQTYLKVLRVAIPLLVVFTLCVLVAHQHDSHHKDGPCVLCLFVTSLDLPATGIQISAISLVIVLLLPLISSQMTGSATPRNFLERAPPTLA
ncbi:MAG: hypothetical protein ABIJ61_12285 [bacterium]